MNHEYSSLANAMAKTIYEQHQLERGDLTAPWSVLTTAEQSFWFAVAKRALDMVDLEITIAIKDGITLADARRRLRGEDATESRG